MPLQATSGAASYDAFGGGVPVVPAYIEEVFSTTLYTGNGSTQTITNGIDLSTKGGLVWIKERTQAGYDHALFDTARGVNKQLKSNLTNAEVTYSGSLTSFGTTGFTLGADSAGGYVNDSLTNHVSWTFRKQPKFFDIQTWTGDGTESRVISHNLGSAPGCIIIKRTDTTSNWFTFHRSATENLYLNSTTAGVGGLFFIASSASATFTLGTNTTSNASGGTYVAYLFAHDAGGFGLTGTDNVISCGSFTTDGSGAATVNLGYEPQFIIRKATSTTSNWLMLDTMRGWNVSGSDAYLYSNSAAAEDSTDWGTPTATGFTSIGSPSVTYIYIAIRRGPMKVPTDGTKVFAPLAVNNSTGTVNTTGFPIDLQMQFYRPGGLDPGTSQWVDRLRGFSSTSTGSGTRLYTTSTQEEIATAIGTLFNNTGFSTGSGWGGLSMSYNNFGRAPGFFDEVCYLGTGSTQNVTHNLGVIPGFIVCKRRNGTANWCALAGTSNGTYESLYLNTTVGTLYTAPSAAVAGLTATTFNPQAVFPSEVNTNGDTYVAYLFATCAGVSKVGSYTGNGSSQTINCGFTGGARFVMVKATSTTGNWIVADSARGIVAGNDPALYLNSTAAEVTGLDWIDADNSGFVVNETATIAANTNGVSYIFFAVA